MTPALGGLACSFPPMTDSIAPFPVHSIDSRDRHGPFDVVGDVHGCLDELVELLTRLGYVVGDDLRVTSPAGRTLVFLGDLIDRGPSSAGVLWLVTRAARDGLALCVIGNHDEKLRQKLHGRNVQVRHGLEDTLAQLTDAGKDFSRDVRRFLDGLPPHLLLDGGKLVVAHAGLRVDLHGEDTPRARAFVLYGDTTGKFDEHGLPVRLDWAAKYSGRALVVYGHTPVPEPRWLNNTVNIDTGCAFGGQLSALRYPELEVVSVPARRAYAERRGITPT